MQTSSETAKEVLMPLIHPRGRSHRTANVVALILVLVLMLAIAVFAAACGGTSTTTTATSAAAGGAQVAIKGFAFNPASVTIKAGESVTWTNQDGTTHDVAGDKGEFDSGSLGSDSTFTFTFAKAGTYAYHCSIHPNMTGTIIVQ
jgi:plastocyanin